MRRPSRFLRCRQACLRPLLRLHYWLVEGRVSLRQAAVDLALSNWTTVPDEWHLVADFARRYPGQAMRVFALLEERESLRRRLARRGQWLAAVLAALYGLEAAVLALMQAPWLATLFALFSLGGFAYVLALSRATRRQHDARAGRRVKPP